MTNELSNSVIILLLGVSGAGKTTVGQAFAAGLGWKFADADDYHTPANISKMHAGIPLDDSDRAPWLQALHDAIEEWLQQGESVVLACSALKDSYRALLMVSPQVKLVYLRASYSLIADRLAARHVHYMDPNLLSSQFETLQEPSDALVIDADQPIRQIVTEIQSALGLHDSHTG